ncbi:hypothetical protein [Adhaeribacter aquaticus]|uniref:hypothetical protein n=1 Tax=Adhaeribacter aquaticus TaxID=299567 RepID=UPI000410F133|nr:hypothetical protein [Adhaeribacter aquaticus]
MELTKDQIYQLALKQYPINNNDVIESDLIDSRIAFARGFKANPNTYTKEEVQEIINRQLEVAAEEACTEDVPPPYYDPVYEVDKKSILNCTRIDF